MSAPRAFASIAPIVTTIQFPVTGICIGMVPAREYYGRPECRDRASIGFLAQASRYFASCQVAAAEHLLDRGRFAERQAPSAIR